MFLYKIDGDKLVVYKMDINENKSYVLKKEKLASIPYSKQFLRAIASTKENYYFEQERTSYREEEVFSKRNDTFKDDWHNLEFCSDIDEKEYNQLIENFCSDGNWTNRIFIQNGELGKIRKMTNGYDELFLLANKNKYTQLNDYYILKGIMKVPKVIYCHELMKNNKNKYFQLYDEKNNEDIVCAKWSLSLYNSPEYVNEFTLDNISEMQRLGIFGPYDIQENLHSELETSKKILSLLNN